MSPLRERMIEGMILAGLALGTRQAYTHAVRRLAARYRRSPDQLSEEELRGYLLELRQQGAARGTFKIGLYGLRFFYQHTLRRDWDLFWEQRIVVPGQKRVPHALSEDVNGFSKLAIVGLIAAVPAMQLVMARDGRTGQPIADAVDMPALRALTASLEGRTPKLKNPPLR
jgi:hypothetical protein